MKIELKKTFEGAEWWWILYTDGQRQYAYATEERGTSAFNALKGVIEKGEPTEIIILSEDVTPLPQQG